MSVTALRRLAHRHGLTLEKGHTRAELLVQVKAHIEKKLPEHLDVALGGMASPPQPVPMLTNLLQPTLVLRTCRSQRCVALRTGTA